MATLKTPQQKAIRKQKRMERLQRQSLEQAAIALTIEIKPKFKVGDAVNCPPTLYKETKGEITEIERLYSSCNEKGQILRFRCDSLEREFYIPKDKSRHDKPWVSEGNKDITYEFSGPNMIIGRWKKGTCPGLSIEPVWYMICTRYSYVVKTENMNTIFSENSLKLI